MFFHFGRFIRRCHYSTTWSCEGIHDVQHQHLRESPKGELLPFEPSSNMHIGWVTLSLLFPSCCLHDTSRERRSDIGRLATWTFTLRSAHTYWMQLRNSTHASTSSFGTPTPPYLLIVLIHVMLDGHIILTTSLHPMHGLTHIMIALLHLVFPCHP